MTWPPLPPGTPPVPPRPSRLRTTGAILAVAGGLLLVAAFVAVRLIRPVARIEGSAMAPFLQDDDRTLFFPFSGPVERGTVVKFRYPRNRNKSFVERVVGLPGERLSIVNGVVFVGGVRLSEPYVAAENRSFGDFGPIQLGPDEYFVLGDNRRNASDSREWGPVARGDIQGRFSVVWYRRK